MKHLYHIELGFPVNFTYPTTTVPLEWGVHAKEQASRDRYGDIDLLEEINTNDFYPIEIDFDSSTSTIYKMVLRSKYNIQTAKYPYGLNVILVVCPRARAWFVKTTWYNQAIDKHSTLDETKYTVPAFKLPNFTIDILSKV